MFKILLYNVVCSDVKCKAASQGAGPLSCALPSPKWSRGEGQNREFLT